MFQILDLCFTLPGNVPSNVSQLNSDYSSNKTQVQEIIENDCYIDFDCFSEQDDLKGLLDSPKYVLSRNRGAMITEPETEPSNVKTTFTKAIQNDGTPKHISTITSETPVNKVRTLRKSLMVNLF